MQRQTTFSKIDEADKTWHLVDAEGHVLGRLATEVATILMGKHRPEYAPNVDNGDYVVVVNAGKIKLTGRKLDHKFHRRYTGYPGGQTSVSYRQLRDDRPEKLIELAVRRMLPKTGLGDEMMKKMKVYAGPKHPHAAQQPVALSL